MLSFSLVAEALTGLIYHRPSGENSKFLPCWKILHRCLPTAKRLAGRSPFFPSSTCQVCEKHEENLTHLFFLCPSAKKIWKHITTLLRQRFPTYANYSVTFKDILCDFSDLDGLRNSSVARFLRDIGLRDIWQHRNAIVYSDQQPDTLCIFKAKIKQKVKTEFQIAKLSGKLENSPPIPNSDFDLTQPPPSFPVYYYFMIYIFFYPISCFSCKLDPFPVVVG